MGLWRQSLAGRGKRVCKRPEAGVVLDDWRNGKKANVAEGHRADVRGEMRIGHGCAP